MEPNTPVTPPPNAPEPEGQPMPPPQPQVEAEANVAPALVEQPSVISEQFQPEHIAAAPALAVPVGQTPDNLTVNTASVESKVGLYTKVTFVSLWVLVLTAVSFLTTLMLAESDLARAAIFFISVAVIATPIFYTANRKRATELKLKPELVDDIFLKKYLRKNLFWAIVFSALSSFAFIWTLLNTLFISDSSGGDNTKTIVSALISALGFGVIVVFSWGQHSKTTR